MSTTIKYTNLFGNTITINQIDGLDKYCKLTFIDNKLKMNELFLRKSKSTSYYLSDDEDKETIVAQYSNENLKHGCEIFFNEYNEGGYTLWDTEEYSNSGVLLRKGKTVYNNSNGKAIMRLEMNILTNTVIEGQKYHYGNQFEAALEDLLIKFLYDDSGQITYIQLDEETYGYIWEIDLQQFLENTQLSQVDFPWSQNVYFHGLYPLITGGSV